MMRDSADGISRLIWSTITSNLKIFNFFATIELFLYANFAFLYLSYKKAIKYSIGEFFASIGIILSLILIIYSLYKGLKSKDSGGWLSYDFRTRFKDKSCKFIIYIFYIIYAIFYIYSTAIYTIAIARLQISLLLGINGFINICIDNLLSLTSLANVAIFTAIFYLIFVYNLLTEILCYINTNKK